MFIFLYWKFEIMLNDFTKIWLKRANLKYLRKYDFSVQTLKYVKIENFKRFYTL